MNNNNYKEKVTIFDLYFALTCIKKFATFKYGTIGSKTIRLNELVVIFSEFNFTWYNELDTTEIMSLFFKVLNKIYSAPNIETFEHQIKTKYKRDYINAKKTVDSFFIENELGLKKHEILPLYVVGDVKVLDKVHNRYLCANALQVFCFDTTERCGVYYTPLLDMSTRRSVQFIFQQHKPEAKDIISLLHSHFGIVEIDPDTYTIVNCDCAGENTAFKVIEYCQKHNIQALQTLCFLQRCRSVL